MRQMNWHLVCTVEGVTLGKFAQNNIVVASDDRGVISMLPSFVQGDYPQGENS